MLVVFDLVLTYDARVKTRCCAKANGFCKAQREFCGEELELSPHPGRMSTNNGKSWPDFRSSLQPGLYLTVRYSLGNQLAKELMPKPKQGHIF